MDKHKYYHGDLKYKLYTTWTGLKEYVTRVPTKSTFYSTGKITPDEFVRTGDLLVSKSPSWQWAAGNDTAKKKYLPQDKQFLICKNAQCPVRIDEMENDMKNRANQSQSTEKEIENGWITTDLGLHHSQNKEKTGKPINYHVIKADSSSDEEEDDEDGMLHIVHESSSDDSSDEEDEDEIEEEEEQKKVEEEEEEDDDETYFLDTRTYDISITYDITMQTPAVWLMGYTSNQKKLTREQIFEDIHKDYRGKSVTFDKHPHLSSMHAHIHHCRHDAIMKTMVDGYYENNGEYIGVEAYLYLFLKIISGVIPTIRYDFTIST
mmetsp:Transcript_12579/g.18859  ORF Transcript_12579/g.18859 Transcript_12579/m.18859 type:complete len:320 (-) Transcript_12579:55-1014(-)